MRTAPDGEALARRYPWALRVLRFDDDEFMTGVRKVLGSATTPPRFPLSLAWGPGPWQEEPDLIEWRSDETPYRLMIVRGGFGVLCGYVGVPPGHPCHGKDWAPIETRQVTFTGECRDILLAGFEPSDHWWFGFDCAEGRAAEADAMFRLVHDYMRSQGLEPPNPPRANSPYVPLDECRELTEAIARELSELESK